ncbi:ATP-binding cassette domain-containing protein [Tenacibaculum jejuense]|uniref:Probably involved in regulation of translation initiation n=1 Tax=Tenacibaculum jejuense TaxID=584609 RepID=A0A238U986_9FLAO|nr:ATP-binding cassette domain-containing protein [Tenacibaculum jejuense]SNR15044.1 Probably involved in regulation of translation initiation [Tenacibaculum jejuense]
MKLKASNINIYFRDKQILNNVAIECNTGDIIGVFGRNGSGKSTLLKALFGTLQVSRISIKINNEIITQKDIIKRRLIGYLPQNTFLPKEKKVRTIIPLFFSKPEDQEKVFYDQKIASFENQKIGTLSIGELRYLEIVLIGQLNHPFLLLDEPFSMVEPNYIKIISDLLMKLKEKKGIIITDHYYNDVLKITNINYIIKNGEKHLVKNQSDLVKYNYLSKK